ncbi:uncharacterized protein LOC100367181 [Saccoglossus kowalevskii]|uniref:Polcalcin Bra r 1-like n=1 Tax=Saccoglossus kowalevskii TaxID=10224 RepID=A0ABM0GYR7_SACKO|nr:PREDICTED: polcalcin Bra r 1-like [Saccoglossus kowalevskii]
MGCGSSSSADDLTAEEHEKAFTVFRKIDVDHSGFLTINELRTALKETGDVSDEDVDKMMEAIDDDGDGVIEFNEFKQLWKAGRDAT